MFERFTDKARRVVVLAQECARNLNHNYTGTEHLLAGILRLKSDEASVVLMDLGVTEAKVEDQITRKIGLGSTPPSGNIPLTPRAKKSFEFALRTTLELNESYIRPIHLMLGIMRHDGCVAIDILRALGIEPELLRAKLLEVASPPQTEPSHAIAEHEAVNVPLDGPLPRSLEELEEQRSLLLEILGLILLRLGDVQFRLNAVDDRLCPECHNVMRRASEAIFICEYCGAVERFAQIEDELS